MKKGWIGCLIAAGVVVVAGFLFLIVIAAIVNGAGGGEEFVEGPTIAHIDLEGVISSQTAGGIFGGGGESMVEKIKKSLKKAREDEDVKAIVLRVNSPGGEVTASDTIYHAVQEANAEKPVVVFMDSLAASGGYYVACAATEIVANETTLTGSIGVIIQTLNYKDLFGKVGLDAESFTSGEFKDTLSGSRTMRPDEKAYVQNLVMQMYDKFLGIVSEGRDIPIERLKKNKIADGRIFTGKEALEKNLVDANGYIEDAYDRARELADAPDAKVIHLKSNPTFFEIMFAGAQQAAGGSRRVEIDVSNRLLPRLEPGMMYFLPSFYAP